MSIGFPKPAKRKTLKRRKLRVESLVKQQVRAHCVERDGDCRLAKDHPEARSECRGESEWAHLEEKKRARTRGMAPSVRHTVEKSMMLCSLHHHAYDVGTLTLTFTSDCGAEGAVAWGRHAVFLNTDWVHREMLAVFKKHLGLARAFSRKDYRD